ncbi:hypothetical protein EDF46_3372 [Frondihabitans sp. PhB188]|uniref:hypothetical protein n=1 Tax=Frondihabitans sp. PhB188 TaxID=2485200 RepID=UPI000FA77E74|nr:hypothetical protein [Frondihabitans sp. PhB188]ROQ30864.1 hypothetical protein EDF46_3372 [Frondihabitans sp. PhB188]
MHSVTVTVSFPDRAGGVDLENIRSSILDLFWEGDADDVQVDLELIRLTAQR